MNKETINKIKEEIKSTGAEQRFLKGQRKTENLKGERQVSAWDAAERVRGNKSDLMNMNFAYYILKHRLEIPSFDDSNPRSKKFVNRDAFIESVKACTGGKCWIFEDDYYVFRSAEKVLSIIKRWESEYGSEPEKEGAAQGERRLYVLADKSLPPVYACVQCGHCAVQYVMEHPDGWKNEYLVYLYADLDEWVGIMERMGMDFSEFTEPDMDGKLTAVAVESDGRIFRKLKLVS